MMLRKTRAVKIIIQRILRGARSRSHGWNLDECYLSQNLVKCMFFVRHPLPRGTTSSFGAAGGAICMSRGVGAGIVDVYAVPVRTSVANRENGRRKIRTRAERRKKIYNSHCTKETHYTNCP
ncbi:hypothetical protein YC2023_011119 [Brassica napus]